MSGLRRSSRHEKRRVYADPGSSDNETTAEKPRKKPQRQAKRAKTEAYDELQEESDASEESVAEIKSTMKAPKIAPVPQTSGKTDPKWKRVRGKRGLLQEVVDFPLDILYEIFAYLEPSDMLALSRTSKDLSGLLMTESAASVWRTARENVPDIPPCLSDLNEAQYANLLFCNYCHHCLSPHPLRTVFWQIRKRVCGSCYKKKYAIVRDVGDPRIQAIVDILPMCRVNDSMRRSGPVSLTKYCPSQAKLLADTRMKKQKEGNVALLQWTRQKQSWLQELETHSIACEEWLQSTMESKEDERDRLRKERKKAIFERLDNAGWGEEIRLQKNSRHFDDLLSEKWFKDTRPVTDRIWKNMKDDLIQRVKEIQAKRQDEEISKQWTNRYRQVYTWMKELLSRPRYIDRVLVPVPSIMQDTAIQDTLFRTPISQELERNAMLKPVRALLNGPGFDEYNTQWIEEAIAALQKYSSTSDTGSANLLLATVTLEWNCMMCKERMLFPRVLFHSCCYRNHAYGIEPTQRGTLQKFYSQMGIQPWNPKCLTPTIDIFHGQVKGIIKACGLDPSHATAKVMDELDPLLECSELTAEQGRRAVCSWRYAFKRTERYALRSIHRHKADWRMLQGKDAEQARILRKPLQEPPYIPNLSIKPIVCNHCKAYFDNPTTFKDHVRSSHGHEPTHQDWEWTEMLRNDIYKYEEPIHMPLEAKSGHEARTSAAPDMTPQ